MIKYLVFVLFTFSFLQASKILSYNVYDRTDRADVMVTFDTPYHGVIKQSIGNSKIIIKLNGASIESSKIKKVSSKFLSSITITPMLNRTQIIAIVPSSVKLVASKTSDAYGLRLRFIQKNAKTTNIHNQEIKQIRQESTKSLPTLKGTQMSTSYYIVVVILVLGISFLLYFKNKVIKQTTRTTQKNNWLFKGTQDTSSKISTTEDINNSEKLSIRFQKELDSKNSVIMLDFSEYSYLLIVGEGNILLEKFTENKPTSKEDFDSILQERHQVLSDFLQTKESTKGSSQNSSQESPIEALQAYKEKAASMIYES